MLEHRTALIVSITTQTCVRSLSTRFLSRICISKPGNLLSGLVKPNPTIGKAQLPKSSALKTAPSNHPILLTTLTPYPPFHDSVLNLAILVITRGIVA